MKFTKEEHSWIFYDWANSAYSMTVTTAILPIFFTSMMKSAGYNELIATSYWGYGNSFASIFVAVLSPILGRLADYMGMKKKLFTAFSLAGIVCTFLLAFIPFGAWLPLLFLYVLTAIGFSLSNVFYDSFLTDVTTPERMNEVSTRGFALGYIGSTIPFIISMLIIFASQNEWILLPMVWSSRIAVMITAIWWFIFTLPMLKNVKQKYGITDKKYNASEVFVDLKNGLVKIFKNKKVFYFLLAYFFYIDGVDTIIKMCTTFGTALGINATTLLLILLFVQFVAFPFSIIYGKLADKFGTKIMIYVGVAVYTVICIYAYFIHSVLDFWLLAFLTGSSQGGIQAISRSHFAQLIPKENSNEFFGFYNIFGKFAAILGPALMALATQLTANVKNGVLSLIALFALGIIFLFVESRQKN